MLYKTGVESHLRKVQGKTYQELGLEFLQKRRWCRKMFPSAIIEWNKLDSNIRKSETPIPFKSKILKLMRRITSSIFGSYNHIGVVKLVTRLRFRLGHWQECKVKHKVQDTLNPLCIWEKRMKLLLTFSFDVPVTLTKDQISWTKSEISITNYKLCHTHSVSSIRRLGIKNHGKWPNK